MPSCGVVAVWGFDSAELCLVLIALCLVLIVLCRVGFERVNVNWCCNFLQVLLIVYVASLCFSGCFCRSVSIGEFAAVLCISVLCAPPLCSVLQLYL